MQTGDDILFTAPGPDFGTIPTATTEIVGTPGNGFNVYWIVTHFPIGSVLSGPFPQKDSPNVLDDENYVHISWLPAPGASSYDLLVTSELQLPKQPGRFLLEANLTSTEFRDRGESLDFYDVGGIPRGAPQEEHVYFNNRDFEQPTLQFIPWPIQVSSIIFEDGTSMSTAGGGGGAGNPAPPNQSVQFNNNGIFGGSDNLIFDSDFNRITITGNENFAGLKIVGLPALFPTGAELTITPARFTVVFPSSIFSYRFIVQPGNLEIISDSLSLNSGAITLSQPVAIGTNISQYALTVGGDINIIDNGEGFTYRINGVPFGGGGGTPAGSNTQIQYNNNGIFGASPNLTFNDFGGGEALLSVASFNIGPVGGDLAIIVPNQDTLRISPGAFLVVTPAFSTITPTFFVNTLNGNVGINTNNPGALLDITDTRVSGIYSTGLGFRILNSTWNLLSLDTDASAMQIFDVNGAQLAMGVAYDYTGGQGYMQARVFGSPLNVLINPLGGDVAINNATPQDGSGANVLIGGRGQIGLNTAQRPRAVISGQEDSAAFDSGYLAFSTWAPGGTGVEHMRINSAGRVDITGSLYINGVQVIP